MTDGDDEHPGMTAEEFADVAEHLAYLASPAGQRRSELVKQLRPSWSVLGYALDEMTGAWASAISNGLVSQAGPGFPAGAVVVRPSSPADVAAVDNDHPHVNEHNELVLRLIRGQIAAVIDHLVALATLLKAEAPIRAGFAGARALLVAAVQLHSLVDDTLQQPRRVTRAVNLALTDLWERQNDQDDGNNSDLDREELQQQFDDLLGAGERDGLRRKTDKARNFVPYERVEAIAESLSPGAGRLIWRQLSSSAHSMDRGATASLSSDELVPGLDERVRRAYAVDGIYRAVVFAEAALEVTLSYLGASSADLDRKFDFTAFHELWTLAGMFNGGALGKMVDAIIAHDEHSD